MSNVAGLYHPAIVRHARAPRRFGPLAQATTGCDVNRPCGDRLCVHLGLDDLAVGFEGEGCALSIAAASALCEAAHGQPRELARAIATAFLRALAGEAHVAPLPGDLPLFLVAAEFPARVGCVALASRVLLAALDKLPAR